MMEKTASRQQSDRLFACINQFRILFALRRSWPHPKQTIFAVQKNLTLYGEVIGYAGWCANTKIDVSTFRDIFCDTSSKLITSHTFHHKLLCRLGY